MRNTAYSTVIGIEIPGIFFLGGHIIGLGIIVQPFIVLQVTAGFFGTVGSDVAFKIVDYLT